DRVDGRCYICGRNEAQSGHPIEAHHFPIERSLAEMVDWDIVKKDAQEGNLGPYAKDFDWGSFDSSNPYSFVDDMTVNGLPLCKDHHTGKGMGIHMMPHPLWIAQKYGKEGYQFSAIELIHHQY
ncbi:MAG TPA: hypothetical protein VFM18_10290, partial [Methanosarcina sp.]|nr:hypothetical protein [Methanosarcina sp.]